MSALFGGLGHRFVGEERRQSFGLARPSCGIEKPKRLRQPASAVEYKRSYLGLCRIFIEGALKQAFEDYVEHEQTMRTELKRLAASGESLKTWRRRFVLDPVLRPCRQSVISDPYIRARSGSGWTLQRGAKLTPTIRASNAAVLKKLTDGATFAPDTRYATTELAQKHEIASVPLKDIIDALVEYEFEDPKDTVNFTGLLITASEAWRRDPTITGTVFRMRPGVIGHRSVNEAGTIEFFLQGKTDRPGGYPGDSVFQEPGQLTLQIHTYDLREHKKDVAAAAPLVAVHIPPALARNWLMQAQQGQT